MGFVPRWGQRAFELGAVHLDVLFVYDIFCIFLVILLDGEVAFCVGARGSEAHGGVTIDDSRYHKQRPCVCATIDQLLVFLDLARAVAIIKDNNHGISFYYFFGLLRFMSFVVMTCLSVRSTTSTNPCSTVNHNRNSE